MDNLAYVYGITVDGVIRYIGKGSGNRASVHLRYARRLQAARAAGEIKRDTLFYNRLVAAIESQAKIETVILERFDSDGSAFAREKELIKRHRRQLWNLSEGGVGITSREARQMWETRDRDLHSKTMRAALAAPEVRKRISNGTKAGLADPSVRQKRREAQKAAASRADVKQKKSAASRAKWLDPAYRTRVLAAQSAEHVRQRMSKAAKKRGGGFTSETARAAARISVERRAL